MKNILIGLLAFGSISKFAMTEFEETLSLNEVFLQESKDYEIQASGES